MICGWIIGNGLVEKVVACLRFCPSVDCTKLRQSPIRLVFGQDSIPAPQLQYPARCESCNLSIMHQVSRAEGKGMLTWNDYGWSLQRPSQSPVREFFLQGLSKTRNVVSEIRTGTSRSHVRLANALRSPTAGRKDFQQQDLSWKLRGFRTCLMHFNSLKIRKRVKILYPVFPAFRKITACRIFPRCAVSSFW